MAFLWTRKEWGLSLVLAEKSAGFLPSSITYHIWLMLTSWDVSWTLILQPADWLVKTVRSPYLGLVTLSPSLHAISGMLAVQAGPGMSAVGQWGLSRETWDLVTRIVISLVSPGYLYPPRPRKYSRPGQGFSNNVMDLKYCWSKLGIGAHLLISFFKSLWEWAVPGLSVSVYSKVFPQRSILDFSLRFQPASLVLSLLHNSLLVMNIDNIGL